MSQRNVELLIGRLLTDEEFRQTFVSDPEGALRHMLESGTHLTHSEIAAMVAIDSKLWRRVADKIDPRLQKAALKLALIDDQPVGDGEEE